MQETLQHILQTIYREQPDNALLISLLQFLAQQLRHKHDQQFRLPQLDAINIQLSHHDLTNWSNLLVTQVKQATPITLAKRAEDLSKLWLPDDYWRVFKHMYFNHEVVPAEFSQLADRLREQHRSTRTAQQFSEQDIWLWDNKSAQAMVILNRGSKKRYRKILPVVKQIWRVLCAALPLYWQYRCLLPKAFKKSVCLKNRIAIALHAEYAAQELPLLAELHNIPVLIRIGCHESETQWQQSITLIKQLCRQGIEVNVALLQNRLAVTEPQRWQHFLEQILPAIHSHVNWIELGHAINRVKWGIWSADEYYPLIEISRVFLQRYPKLRFTGPAIIDFEWHRTIDALANLPRKFKFFALSQHLYVDRRGAPENYQGKFSTVEKCTMLKAIAKTSRHCEERVIVSEVNWPLQDTGIWSPIGSPYTAPEWFRDRPGVDENTYANYLVRYLALTLCSGFVEQVCWWRLSAHGYGLVDDQNQFKKRPAFLALKNLIEQLGNAEFIERLPSSKSVYLLKFQREKATVLLAWTAGGEQALNLGQAPEKIVTRDGAVQLANSTTITLTEQPIYVIV